jgi:hypothetical protein
MSSSVRLLFRLHRHGFYPARWSTNQDLFALLKKKWADLFQADSEVLRYNLIVAGVLGMGFARRPLRRNAGH